MSFWPTRRRATTVESRQAQPLPPLADFHCLVVGGTRRGKTGALQLMARSLLSSTSLSSPGREGLTMIDPVGGCPREIRDWMANPANGQSDRCLHWIDTISSHTVGVNALQVEDLTSFDECHAAASTLISVIEAKFGAGADETPRLSRLIYVTAMACARKGLTLIEAFEVLSLGGHFLRSFVLTDFSNHAVRRELEDLVTLATRQPREFLLLVESTHNRLLRWIGSPALARILGQRRGLRPRTVIDRGEIALADFSGAPPDDAAFLGCLMNALYFLDARKRPPLKGLRHRLMLDEAEALLTLHTSRMTDQSAKHGLLLTASIQRLGQARSRGDDMLESLMVNCGLKICFGGLESDSARYMAENLYAGHIDLEEWKQSTIRPTVVGNDTTTVRGRTIGRHHSEQAAESETDMRSSGRMRAVADANMHAWGSVFSSGFSSGTAMLPDGGLITAPTMLNNTSGSSSLSGRSSNRGRSRVRSAAQHEADGHARTAGRGEANGTVDIASENETYVSRFADLPQQQFTLEEQLAKATWHLQTLERRYCVVRLEHHAPFTTRTADLAPAFRNAAFRDQVLPLFMSRANARSPYARPAAEVDAEIAERLARLTTPQPVEDPDFTEPEPAHPAAARLRIVPRG